MRYRSFKDIPMLARQRSIFVIVIGLLVWVIVANSEVALMVIASSFVASGLALHLVRITKTCLFPRPLRQCMSQL